MRLQPIFGECVRKRKAALSKKSGLQVGASAMDDGFRGYAYATEDCAPQELGSANLPRRYFNDVLILPKLVASLVPTP